MTNLYNYITQLSNPLFRLGYVDGNGVYCIPLDNLDLLRKRIGAFKVDQYIHKYFPNKYMIVIWKGENLIREWNNKENVYNTVHGWEYFL